MSFSFMKSTFIYVDSGYLKNPSDRFANY